MSTEKKKHIANRQLDNALNDGLRFDEQLKAKRAAERAKSKQHEKKTASNNSAESKD